ncbi:DUF3060 domain-containing protein [Melittangium boletus]|uniref:DUF3060 domain-containing protein n=1 Tax=Melittangium boletus TaxID=83453 RepID=UPI003DA2FE40
MVKSIRTAAFLVVLGLGATAGAQGGIQVGSNGEVKVGTGSSGVQVGSGGDVSVRSPGAQIEVDAPRESSRRSEGTSRKTGAQVHLSGTGQKQNVTCEDGGEVKIEGTSNEYVIEGRCARVSVEGTDNTVSVNTVDQVTVEGTDNKMRVNALGQVTVEGTSNEVIWKRTVGAARKPKVSTEGVDNKVYQAR